MVVDNIKNIPAENMIFLSNSVKCILEYGLNLIIKNKLTYKRNNKSIVVKYSGALE